MSKLVRIDKATFKKLKVQQVTTGVPMGKQIRFKILGNPKNVKVMGRM